MDEKHEGREIKVGDRFRQKRPSNGNSERQVLETTRTGVVMQAAMLIRFSPKEV